jgi:hypothetical protein
MLSEQLPKCVCGSHDYSGGGGYVGPDLAYSSFKCNSCGRSALELHPWVFFDRNTGVEKDDRVMSDYINDVVLPFRREQEELRKTRAFPTTNTLLPQIPDALSVFVVHGGEDQGKYWTELDRDESAKAPLPVDPIAVRHREFWGPVVESTGAHEIPNQYYNDQNNLEPWYEFKVPTLDATIQFGPRKRVLVIRVTGDKDFRVSKIAELAEKDNTTFYADDQWQPWDAKRARHMEVHAWGKDKFDSYLSWIMFELGRTAGDERAQ